MRFLFNTPLMNKILFVTVLILGVIIWRLGVNYLEEPEAPTSEVQQFQIKPL